MNHFTQEANHLLQKYGINLMMGNAKGFAQDGTHKDGSGNFIAPNLHLIAQDADLVTNANSTIPAALFSYWDPKAIKVLTAVRSATEMYKPVKKGTFASPQINFRTTEFTGGTQPYSDFANDGMSDVNNTFPYRDVYRFQTNIVAGDLEVEMSGEAKISLVSDKQNAAANAIAIDENKFFLKGVEGLQIFGSLNDPSLSADLAPLPNEAGDTEWADKTNVEIYDDVLYLFQELVDQMGGHVNSTMPLTLSISPTLHVLLGKSSQYNQSVLEMLNKYLTNLKVVVVPELQAEDGTQTMQLKCDSVLGQETGVCSYGERFRAYPVYRKESSLSQKVAAATSGTIIFIPAAVASMSGM